MHPPQNCGIAREAYPAIFFFTARTPSHFIATHHGIITLHFFRAAFFSARCAMRRKNLRIKILPLAARAP
jgi:hypothetical protein